MIVWSLPDGARIRTFAGHSHWVESLAASKDGRWLCSGGSDKKILVWDLSSGKLARTLEGHSDWVRALAITDDSKTLISAGADRTIRFWNLTTGNPQGCVMDLGSNQKTVQGTQYKGTDTYGRTVTFTQPCGTPIPPGAVCTCNCVAGSMGLSNRTFSSTGVCTCDLVCTCNTVCTCQSVCSCLSVSHYWRPN